MSLERAWSPPGQRVTDLQEEAEVEVVRAWASQTDKAGDGGGTESQRKEREARGCRWLGPRPSTHLCSATRYLERTHQRLDVAMTERRGEAPSLQM